MRAVMLALVMLAACKGGSSSSGGAGGSSFDKLKVTFGGAATPMAHAFIKRIPVTGRFQLYVTEGDSSCEELIDNMWMHEGKSKRVLFDVGPRLGADQKLTTQVTYVYVGGDTATIKPGSKVTISNIADKGTTTDIAIDADIDINGKADQAIALHGTFTAAGCGERAEADTSGVPKAPHPSKATIEVAGHKLPIVGATIKGPAREPATGAAPQREILLSTGPKDCSGSTPWAALIVERHDGFWRLHGVWFEGDDAGIYLQNESALDKDGQPETKNLAVTVGAKGTSADGATAQLDLSGSGTIKGIPVAISGTVEAIDCGEGP